MKIFLSLLVFFFFLIQSDAQVVGSDQSTVTVPNILRIGRKIEAPSQMRVHALWDLQDSLWGAPLIEIDAQNSLFTFGDVISNVHGTKIQVDDNLQRVNLICSLIYNNLGSPFDMNNGNILNGNINYFASWTATAGNMVTIDNSDRSGSGAVFDFGGKLYSIGDVSGISNNTKIRIDDDGRHITAFSPVFEFTGTPLIDQGNTFIVQQGGSNPCAGTGTLINGVATISTTCIFTGDQVAITPSAPSGKIGVLFHTATVNQTSFTLTSYFSDVASPTIDTLDNSTFIYTIIHH